MIGDGKTLKVQTGSGNNSKDLIIEIFNLLKNHTIYMTETYITG